MRVQEIQVGASSSRPTNVNVERSGDADLLIDVSLSVLATTDATTMEQPQS